MKLFEKIKINYTVKFSILGLTIYKKYYDNGCGYIKFLFLKIKYKNFLKEYIKKTNTHHKKINIALVNAGESFIFAISANYIFDDTLWIVEQSYTKEIFDLYTKNLQDIVLLNNFKLGYILRTLKHTNYKYNDIDINIYFPQYFWDKFWTNTTPKHYIEVYKDIFKFDVKNIELAPIKISEEVKQHIETLLSDWELNIEKLIILFPDATSINPIPLDFWLKVVNALKSLGFSVFVNSNNSFWLDKGVYLNIENGKQKFLNITDIYYLCSLSKKILGIRSGFIELLLSSSIDLYILYNNSHTFPNQNVQKLYSLKNYPKNNEIKIIEENYTRETENILLNNIINKYKNKEVL